MVKVFFKQLKNNRGSGIITVLVAMMFIAILGSALLFTSYTGYRIKIADRSGKESFYSASTVLDEIKSGIQQAVTESLSTAYSDVLSEYTKLSADGDDAIRKKFSDIFLEDLRNWETESSLSLFFNSDTYIASTLYSFISTPPAGDSVVISGGSCSVTKDTHGQWIKMKDISVSYTTANGYVSHVTSDILITMPDFHATTSSTVSSGLPSFAIIANGTLSSEVNNPVITGNAYAGNVSLSLSGNTLTYTGGTFICANTINIENSSSLKANANTEVWAENITLGSKGNAQLYGRTFVADDLTLSGNDSKAELKGSYYGFGLGNTANTSSSIIANGNNTTLNIDGLDKLVLAGVSFIKTSGELNSLNRDVRTGESISVRSNQLAYLVDKSCISVSAYFDKNGNDVYDAGDIAGSVTGSNPFVFTGDHLTYSVNTDLPLWNTDKTLKDYDITSSRIIPVHKNLSVTGGYKMAYYYIDFADQNMANKYFRDYFSANPQRIEEYINVYIDLIGKADTTNTSGNTLYKDALGELEILTDSSVNVQGRSTEFSNRRQTLNPNNASPGSTPYTYYVNQAAITGNIDFKLSESSRIVAKAIKGNYTVDSHENAKVIIATGNVTVSADFNGLIMAGGDVIANRNITYSHSDVEDIIYRAVDSNGNLLSSYLLNTVVGSDDNSGFISSWDLDLLVSYENWSKN